MLWASVFAAWGIPKPRNVFDMFGSWLNGLPKNFKPLVLVGTTTLCWSVWLCRNAGFFDNKQSSYLHVIFSITHWLHKWAILQQHTSQDILAATSLFFGTGGQ